MKNSVLYICVMGLIFQLLGCASARLDIKLDLYDENPRVDKVMTPRKAQSLITDLHILNAEWIKRKKLQDQLEADTKKLISTANNLLDCALGVSTCLKACDEKNKNCEVLSSKDQSGKKPENVDCQKPGTVDGSKQGFENKVASAVCELEAYVKEYQEQYIQIENELFSSLSLQPCKEIEANKSRDSNTRKHCQSNDSPTVVNGKSCQEVNLNACSPQKIWKEEKYTFTKPHLPKSPLKKVNQKKSEIKYKKIEQPIGSLKEEVEKLLSKVMHKKETSALNKVSDAVAAYRNISSSEKNTNQSRKSEWLLIQHKLNTKITHAKIKGDQNAVTLWQEFGKSLEQSVRSLAQRAGYQPVASAQLRSPFAETSLQASSLAIANELEALRSNLPETATARTALAGLVTSKAKLDELVDRLQNAGDPIWRTITDPVNRHHWNTEITETIYKAEGNNSVVVVRDAPMRFRISAAKNNPKVLVESQLEIQSSIADAAINTIGAKAGLPINSSNSSENATAAPAPELSLVSKKAQLQSQINTREKAVLSLERYLRMLLTELEDVGSDKNVEPQVLRLRSILKGHKPLLRSPD